MTRLKLNLIAAATEDLGIGLNNSLPWRLKNEMAHFTELTQHTADKSKRNVVVMGRRTWESIPEKHRPLNERINVVLTKNPESLKPSKDVFVYDSFESALDNIQKMDNVENVWITGGVAVYKMAMDHPDCYKIYLTEIKKKIECDTFFPNIDKAKFKPVDDPQDESFSIPTEKQVENGIEYYFKVYKNCFY